MSIDGPTSGRASKLVRALLKTNEDGWTFALGATVLYAAALIVGHVYHEMWRDELHCFAMGRAASGLYDLLTGERRYDGHPFLWYYVLHLASRINRSAMMAHVVTATLAVVAAALWLRYAAVPRVLRVLLLATYYFLFEYGIMCRSYTLGLALAFGFCALYHPCRIRYVLLGFLLALLAAANFYATLMSLALATFLFSHGPAVGAPDELDGRRRFQLPAEWIVGLCIYIAGLVLTVLTTLPPDDALYRRAQLPDVAWVNVRAGLSLYWIGMIPTHQWLDWIWSGRESFAAHLDLPEAAQPWAGGALLALWLIAFRRSWRVVICYALGVLLLGAGFHLVYLSGVRHLGHYFLLTVACLWLHGRETRGRAPQRLITALLAANVVVEIGIGIVAFRAEVKQQFSGSAEAAAFIRSHGLERRPVVADHPDEPATPVAVLLDRPFFFTTTGETTDVTVFHNRRRGALTEKELLAEAERLAREDSGAALILTSRTLVEHPPGMTVTLLHSGGEAVISDEVLKIYEVRLKDRP